MKLKLLMVGKTDAAYVQEGMTEYAKRIKKYIRFEVDFIPDLRNRKSLSIAEQKTQEGILILNQLKSSDHVVLLDEAGEMFSSVEFAQRLQKFMNAGYTQVVFIIGGPYGFSEEVVARAQMKVSLSKMTFSHQMVRLFIAEQLYRGFSILRNEPYHHQ